ncbi:HD-GYP domain-containing protein [Rhodoferax sp.]|uniref:HD-GYP domain-containing protein n=1 Tax=Rhodoferax sp. TaxID=50421 RepID=UPI00374D9DF9
MGERSSVWIDVAQLRRGLFIQLDLGWMDHPFPKGSFKITSDDQIKTILSLGVSQVRYFPDQSDPPSEAGPGSASEPEPGFFASLGSDDADTPSPDLSEADLLRAQRRERLLAQQRSLSTCERRFSEATRQYRRVVENTSGRPTQMRDECVALVTSCVDDILAEGESAIRLLSEAMGERSAVHPVNVMVISLLLGKALGLPATALADLGLAALLHDLGKTQLAERLRYADSGFSPSEQQVYQEHVEHSVAIGRRMGVSEDVLRSIEQHHELADGSGFPSGLMASNLSASGKILALVNRYDNLCNPPRLVNALTPHEALSMIFAQMKSRFDTATLGAFIRMMGVYPPGSVVQLVNDGYAMVVSVNSARPLKPYVIVFDVTVPRDEALMVDLEHAPELGIRRSLKPSQLPRSVQDYLSPRQRVAYFFERVAGGDRPGTTG